MTKKMRPTKHLPLPGTDAEIRVFYEKIFGLVDPLSTYNWMRNRINKFRRAEPERFAVLVAKVKLGVSQ